jgi:hypothetical protein
MKMSKTCQRLNNKLLTVLAQVNEEAKKINGFSHLSHTVQFDYFPGSLLVLCHFNDEQGLQDAHKNHTETQLQKQLHRFLLKKGVVLKDPKISLKLKGPN